MSETEDLLKPKNEGAWTRYYDAGRKTAKADAEERSRTELQIAVSSYRAGWEKGSNFVMKCAIEKRNTVNIDSARSADSTVWVRGLLESY